MEPSGSLAASPAHRLNHSRYAVARTQNGRRLKYVSSHTQYATQDTLGFDRIQRSNVRSEDIQVYLPKLLSSHQTYTWDLA
jgi:hypothetical protein